MLLRAFWAVSRSLRASRRASQPTAPGTPERIGVLVNVNDDVALGRIYPPGFVVEPGAGADGVGHLVGGGHDVCSVLDGEGGWFGEPEAVWFCKRWHCAEIAKVCPAFWPFALPPCSFLSEAQFCPD